MNEQPFRYSEKQHYLNFIEKYSNASNAATGSEVDSNANVEKKSIATLEGEIYKKEAIAMNRLAMQQRITEMYGRDLADQYIQDLETHRLYRHDETAVVGKPYCASITMYPFLLHGLRKMGGSSTAPHNLKSFLGSFVNLAYAAATQLAGAVSTPEFIPYMDYFIRKEYGDDYYLRADEIVDLSKNHRTIDKTITDAFEQVVYCLNQPAGARNYQSIFWNIAYFDKYYFSGMFEDFVFPDGEPMVWESVSWLQKRFMVWLNEERRRNILTFPVETLNLLDDGTKFLDDEWADFAAEMWSKGHSFFLYHSDNVDSLASCCFDGDTPVLAKSSNGVFLNIPIKQLHDMPSSEKKNLTVYHNGSWVLAKTIVVDARTGFVDITTANNKTVRATGNHLWPTLDGLKRSDELTTNDWLMFNTRALDAVPEQDRKLTYLQGRLIGMYLGDGSIEVKDCKYKTVHFSLNRDKYVKNIGFMNSALADCGIEGSFTLRAPYNNVYPVSLYGTQLPDFIEEYAETGYAWAKRLKPEVFLQSREFRQGILDGIYATDGGNSNRIYTTSEMLAKDLETLCSTLGLNTIIDTSDRTDEPVIIRDEEYKRNYPLWCVRWYDPHNKRSMGDVYKVVNNSMYFKVTSVEKLDETVSCGMRAYCFECKNQDEPYFTLPNGMITHNCRLRNEIQDNQFSYTLGAGGVSTGSKCVMTMNLNRIVQNLFAAKGWKRDDFLEDDLFEIMPSIKEEVEQQVQRIHQYLTAFNSIVEDRQKAGLLPLYDAGFVSPERQYLTIGINGLVEAAEFLGCIISPNCDKYKFFTNSVLETIYDLNKKDRTETLMFNTEYVPAENLGVKNAKWDKKDGLYSPRDCYNSYFYLSEDKRTSPTDKFILHGKMFTRYLDGGSALHCNLDEHLSEEQYKLLMKFAIQTGCPYFTFNIPNTVCRDCGHISKLRLNKCPKCGSENLDWATRVIGYLKLVSSFSEARQKEEHERYYAKVEDA